MLTIHYRPVQAGYWEVDRGSDPTKGRWDDRFGFDQNTGILSFDLAQSKKKSRRRRRGQSGKCNVVQPDWSEHCRKARQVRNCLKQIHEFALLASKHSGQMPASDETRLDALVHLYLWIDSLPKEMQGPESTTFADYLRSFSGDDISRSAISLAAALADVVKHRASGDSEQRAPTQDESISLRTVAAYSNSIAEKIAVAADDMMKECHATLSAPLEKGSSAHGGRNA